MKGLTVEDKNYYSEKLLDLKKEKTENICPSTKRSIIKKNSKKKTNNICVMSHLNNFDITKLAAESPKKLYNSLQNYQPNLKNNKNVIKKNKKDNSPKKKPFDSKNKNVKINNINTSIFKNSFEIFEIKEFNSYYEIPFMEK